MSIRSRLGRRCGLLLACLTLPLAGCASLPSSGPTAHDIVKAQDDDKSNFHFKIVNLDANVATELNHAEATSEASATPLASLAGDRRTDLIGPGDVLGVTLYEVGVSLFSGGGPKALTGGGFDPYAHSEEFPAVVVDSRGTINLPYLGRIDVNGLTPDQVEAKIEAGLKPKSQDPKAIVVVRQNLFNSIYVSGDVHKPGRYELSLNREHLLDSIAIAGGAVNSPEDTIVRLSRSDHVVEQRLATIRSGNRDDLTLAPGDRVEIVKKPRTYIVFGATSHVSEVPFEKSGVTLAEAIARVGGPSDLSADPSAIMLFRYVSDPQAPTGESPVVYRLNMLTPASYFLAQRVAMHDKDVIYIANAGANRPAKFVGIINQLFAPFVTARQLAP